MEVKLPNTDLKEEKMKTNMVMSFYNLKDEKELDTVLDELKEIEYEKINSKGFDGVGMVMYILSIGGGVVVTQLANIIINLIKKNDNLRVKIGDLEISGYPADAIPQLLDSAIEYHRKKMEVQNDN